MSDLEQDIRDLLDEEVRSAPPPHEGTTVVRRTRRRQGAVIAGGALAAVALVAGSLAGLRAIDRAEGPTFADQPTVSTSINGITMSHPEGWYVADPDEAGLNGPDPTPDLPKLILAVAPFDPGELFACPGMAATPHPFLMTIQEEPLALNGPASSSWPVELEPLDVGAAESGCYPGWEFLRTGWTAAGRTFEARAGFAPDVSDADRDALVAAFASMTFDPATGGATSFILASGTTAGEDWELIARGGLLHPDAASGLELSLEAESVSSGSVSSGMGFDPSSNEFQMSGVVLGTGSDAERVIFGAVPADAVRLGLQVSGGDPVALPVPEILDVPDTIDPDLNAFIFSIRLDQTAVVTAFDDSDTQIASGEVTPGADGAHPTPVPETGQLEDGRHFGFVRFVDVAGRTIEFDLAYWLSGEEANQAYQEATGDRGPVPNDHFVVNDNPALRTLVLAPDARLVLLDWNHCCDATFDGDLAIFARAVELQDDVLDGDLLYRGLSSWWVTVENGVVTRIEEQYSP
jgi:hypothetical protein